MFVTNWYRTWLIKYFFYYKMKELGERLKELRKENGVSKEEASLDLGISIFELESIESGNVKAFKDIYELKHIAKSYAKYLGLDEDKISDEFNEFLFAKTSKIDVDAIREALEKKDSEEKTIHSPYTMIKPSKKELALVVLVILALVLLSLIIYVGLNTVRNKKDIVRELSIVEVNNEFTK